MAVMARKTIIARAKVMEKWLVTAKLNGIPPSRFKVRIKMNTLKINGKYGSPFPKVLSFKVFRIKSCKISAEDCNLPGTSLRWRSAKIRNTDTSKILVAMNKAELVKLTSYPPISSFRSLVSLN